jgi:hypothetical protein
VFLTAAILLSYWAALRLVQRSLLASPAARRAPRAALGYAALAAGALGPGSSLLFVSRPAVFEEAAAWGVAFTLLAMNQVWAWASRERRTLLPAIVLGIAAASSRPTAALVCGVLGLTAIGYSYRNTRRIDSALVVAGLALSLLPGLTAGAVFWLKLGTPFPSPLMNEQVQEAPHWQEIRRRNGDRTMSLAFIPTALVAYLRPDAVRFVDARAFVQFRFPPDPIAWVPPLREGGAYVDRVTSVTATMPLPWLVNLIAIAWLARRAGQIRRSPTRDRRAASAGWLLAAGSFAAAVAMIVLIVTTVGIASRYLADFYPTSAVGMALGVPPAHGFLAGRPVATALVTVVAIALVAWSIVATLSLTTVLVFR